MNTFLSDELPGTDFHHYAAFLGRKKIARVLTPSGLPPQSGWRICYLLHAFSGNRLSWLRYLDFSPFKMGCDLLLVFPESGRRWFINDASGNRYEDYLIEDLVPAIDAAFPTDQRTESRAIGGFSMGGAAAVYLALRYPTIFSAAFSYAGAFYASRREGDPYAEMRANGIMMPTEREHDRVWGPPGSFVRITYDPDELIERAVAERILPKIVLQVGLDDYQRVIEQNRRMHSALINNGIAHAYEEHPGDHSWISAAAFINNILLELTQLKVE